MKVRHTAKVRGFAFKPDDKFEPMLGAIVDVSDALGLALIQRGWGVDVDGKLVINRHDPEESEPVSTPLPEPGDVTTTTLPAGGEE